jgi:triosephosphate isomerase
VNHEEKLIAGNWKMNGGLAANAKLLADILAG